MEGLDVHGLSAAEAFDHGYSQRAALEGSVRAAMLRLPMTSSHHHALPSMAEGFASPGKASLESLRNCIANDADAVHDIVTDALMALARRMETEPLRSQEETRKYLFGALRRIAWDRGLRRVGELGASTPFVQEGREDVPVAAPSMRPDELVETKQQLERIAKVVKTLGPDDRLLLEAWMEDRYQDAVDTLGISHGAARKRVAAVLARIRQTLGVEPTPGRTR